MKKTIKFISITGEECVFKTCRNSMSSSQMWWVEPYPLMYIGLEFAKEAITSIKKNCTILEETDTCDHPLAL